MSFKLELFTLYKIRGYDNPICDPAAVSHSKVSLDKQFRMFKNKFRAIAIRVCTNQVGTGLLTPYKIKSDNLTGIGVAGKYQAPSFNVYVTEQEQHEMATNLYLLNHTLPRIKINKILQGQMTFLVRPFIMMGRADWCNNIKNWTCPSWLIMRVGSKQSSTMEIGTPGIKKISCFNVPSVSDGIHPKLTTLPFSMLTSK